MKTFDIDAFARMVHKNTAISLEHTNSSAQLMFVGNAKQPYCVFDINPLLENQYSKSVAQLIPTYYGLLTKSLDFTAIVIESWTLDFSSISKKYPTATPEEHSAMADKLMKQYGSVSNLPDEFRSETVMLCAEIADESRMYLWTITRDINGKPSLSSFDDCVMMSSKDGASMSGALGDLFNTYLKISELYNRMDKINKDNTGHALPIEVFVDMLSKDASSDPELTQHNQAFKIAKTILEQVPDMTPPTKRHLH